MISWGLFLVLPLLQGLITILPQLQGSLAAVLGVVGGARGGVFFDWVHLFKMLYDLQLQACETLRCLTAQFDCLRSGLHWWLLAGACSRPNRNVVRGIL